MGIRQNTNDIFNFNQIAGQKTPPQRTNYVVEMPEMLVDVDDAPPPPRKKQETKGVITPTAKPSQVPIPDIKNTPQPFDPADSLTVGTGDEFQVEKPETLEDVIKQEGITNRQLEAMQASARFFADVLNANSAYNATTGEARLNIMQARNQAADALYRGRQAQMDAQSEGRQAGESALLAMAVQGQDVSGAAVQKIQSSYEAMGIFNGMREEINAIREALGYQLEEVAYDYQIRNARIARDSAIIGSGLTAGASLIGTL
jgi:hypothetical protein